MQDHRNRKQHRAALQNPVTAALVQNLQTSWNTLTPVARGARLKTLVDRGCTVRGLAEDLPPTEGTLRRLIRVAKLPPAYHRQIEAGASVDPILRGTLDAQRRREYFVRVAEDEKFEKAVVEVMEIANTILDDYMMEHSTHREQVLDDADHRISEWRWLHEQKPSRFPLPPAVAANADRLKVVRESRLVPKPSEDMFWAAMAVEQLTLGLPRIAPDQRVIDEAMKRLIKVYAAWPPFVIPLPNAA